MCAVWLYYPLVGALLCNYVARIARLATTVLPSPPLASVASFFKTGCKVASLYWRLAGMPVLPPL